MINPKRADSDSTDSARSLESGKLFFLVGVHGNLLDSLLYFFCHSSPTPGRLMTWGDGVPATDWALAAEKAGAIGYRVLNGPGSVQGKGGEP